MTRLPPIRQWQHRCWIFPRDPHFQVKAGRILDLYARCCQGQPLREDEFVFSTDEKTSIQPGPRAYPSESTNRARPDDARRTRIHARGCLGLLGRPVLDVHRAKVYGRCEATTGIAPFERLVDQVMSQPPYNEARRVFWIVDNGSSHRGDLNALIARMRSRYAKTQQPRPAA